MLKNRIEKKNKKINQSKKKMRESNLIGKN